MGETAAKSTEAHKTTLDTTFKNLQYLANACERGDVANLPQKLKNFEQSLAEIQKIKANLSTLTAPKKEQQDKLKDLRRQLKLKDDLIATFKNEKWIPAEEVKKEEEEPMES